LITKFVIRHLFFLWKNHWWLAVVSATGKWQRREINTGHPRVPVTGKTKSAHLHNQTNWLTPPHLPVPSKSLPSSSYRRWSPSSSLTG